MEQWVPLLGYPGYSVSNLGKVRNDRMYRVLTVYEAEGKRPFVKVTRDGQQLTRSLSKLVLSAFLPPALSSLPPSISMEICTTALCPTWIGDHAGSPSITPNSFEGSCPSSLIQSSSFGPRKCSRIAGLPY
jgi:hypothetical protein